MYQLNLNKRCARIVIESLDVLMRVGMGQLEIVCEHIPDPPNDKKQPVLRQAIRAILDNAKLLLGHSGGGSYSISHKKTTDEAKIAYDIQCVLRRAVAIEEKLDYSVWNRDPLHVGSEPLMTASVVQPFTEQPFNGDFVGTSVEL